LDDQRLKEDEQLRVREQWAGERQQLSIQLYREVEQLPWPEVVPIRQLQEALLPLRPLMAFLLQSLAVSLPE
jgi:hypothetical protein